jgi:hypothetical protein
MKHILILFTLIATGCEQTVGVRATGEYYNGSRIEIITFDGCEYVRFYNGNATWGAHKGTCNNPIHKTPCK